MDPLLRYYQHQAGRGSCRGVIGSVYSVPPIYQRGYGIGSFLGGLWRMVRPILWSGAKTVGRETLRKGGRSLATWPTTTTALTPKTSRGTLAI